MVIFTFGAGDTKEVGGVGELESPMDGMEPVTGESMIFFGNPHFGWDM